MAFPRSIGRLTPICTSVKGSASIVFSQEGGVQHLFFACTLSLARSFSSSSHRRCCMTAKVEEGIPSTLSSSSSLLFHRTPPLWHGVKGSTSNPVECSSDVVPNVAPVQWKRKKVSFVTDVEGNMRYFQKWVAQSDVICWESKQHLKNEKKEKEEKMVVGEKNNKKTTTDPTVSTSPLLPDTMTYWDLDHVVLGFREDDGTQEFVYGGDAFDQGWDLCFSRALLDFKERFPKRVHLILGNRDLNKIVMKHLFPPSISSSSAVEEEEGKKTEEMTMAGKDAKGVSGPFQTHPYSPFGERFLPLTQQRGVMGELSPLAAEEALFPSKSGSPAKVSYADYLKDMRQVEKEKHHQSKKMEQEEVTEAKLVADPVSFLKWALVHRLGSSRTFENRREELHALRLQQRQQAHQNDATTSGSSLPLSSSPLLPPSDEEVAASFAAAAAPGGVYDRYLQYGQLYHVIHSALFLHGGIVEENIGRVPSIHAPYNVPLQGCRCLFDVSPSSSSSNASVSIENGGEADEKQNASTPLPCTTTPTTTPTLWDWLSALDTFQKGAVDDFHHWKGSKGEALRRYGNHRVYTPYSITVHSPLKTPFGPSFFPLSVLQPLLLHGVRYMCVGHMPCGDSPLLLRQPPLGAFTFVAADNSYCGRGNASSSPSNPRGDAVTEVILQLVGPEMAAHDRTLGTIDREGTSTAVSPVQSIECITAEEEDDIYVHGTRANGAPYAFHVSPSEPFLGRCVRRRRPLSSEGSGEGEGPTATSSLEAAAASLPSSSSSHSLRKREEKWGEVVADEFWWVKRRGIFPSLASSKNHNDPHHHHHGETSSGKGEPPSMGGGGIETRTGHAGESEEEEYYALHCTKDHFFSEKEILIPSSALARIFSDASSFSSVMESDAKQDEDDPWSAFFLPEGCGWSAFSSVVGGQLRNTHTKESLRDVPVSRLKTKVIPPPPSSSS